MLWTLQKVTVGGAPTTGGDKTAIVAILRDVEGVGLESHTFEVPTVNLADPMTVLNAICDLFDASHTPNNFACADRP
jgi:hypothetical protein